jgi:hypothetical protein
MALSFPLTPADGSTHVLGGITFTYSSASNSWVGITDSGSTIISAGAILGDGTAGTPLTVATATEAQAGVAQIISQTNVNVAAPASGNDTDVLTIKKLLNIADPAKSNLKTALDVLTVADVTTGTIGRLRTFVSTRTSNISPAGWTLAGIVSGANIDTASTFPGSYRVIGTHVVSSSGSGCCGYEYNHFGIFMRIA